MLSEVAFNLRPACILTPETIRYDIVGAVICSTMNYEISSGSKLRSMVSRLTPSYSLKSDILH